MQNGYIETRIKKCSWKLIVAGVIGLIVVAAIGLYSVPYYFEFFRGPVEITGQVLEDALRNGYSINSFVSLKADDLVDSGIYDSTTDDDGNEIVDTRYYFAAVDDYMILVQEDPDKKGTNFSGELFWLNQSGKTQFEKMFNEKMIGTDKEFFPVVLLKNGYRLRGYTGLVLLGLALFLSILLITKGAKPLRKMERHPCMKELERFGPLEFTVSRINSEMAIPHEKVDHTHFLATMILEETRYGLSTMRYDEIVWAYKIQYVGKNLAIFQSSTYSLVVHDRYQKTLCLVKNQTKVDNLMTLLLPHIPYACKGYTNELQNLWTKNPKAIIQAVEDRKTAINQPSEVPPISLDTDAPQD